jgi:hypothetical protein
MASLTSVVRSRVMMADLGRMADGSASASLSSSSEEDDEDEAEEEEEEELERSESESLRPALWSPCGGEWGARQGQTHGHQECGRTRTETYKCHMHRYNACIYMWT